MRKSRDGFDSIRVRFQEDPDSLVPQRLDGVSTALRLSPALQIKGLLWAQACLSGPLARHLARPRAGQPRSRDSVGYGRRRIPHRLHRRFKMEPLPFSEEQARLLVLSWKRENARPWEA